MMVVLVTVWFYNFQQIIIKIIFFQKNEKNYLVLNKVKLTLKQNVYKRMD